MFVKIGFIQLYSEKFSAIIGLNVSLKFSAIIGFIQLYSEKFSAIIGLTFAIIGHSALF